MFGRIEDGDLGYLLFYVVFLVEFSRILLGSYFTQPPTELQEAIQEKNKVTQDLSKIKSIQLQFVEHSKLTRKVISLDKLIGSYRDSQSKGLARIKHAYLYLRIAIYGSLCLLYGFKPIAILTSRYFSILAFFMSPNGSIIFLRGWFIILLLFTTVRYSLRRAVLLIPSWRDQLY